MAKFLTIMLREGAEWRLGGDAKEDLHFIFGSWDASGSRLHLLLFDPSISLPFHTDQSGFGSTLGSPLKQKRRESSKKTRYALEGAGSQ